MAKIENHRWCVQPDECVVRIMVPNLESLFRKIPSSKSLVIEPGTRALVIDDNGILGELPSGSYTMETFFERLQFWREKQSTVFLFRAEDITVDHQVQDVPCAENICFDINFRWSFQVSNLLACVTNLFGANECLTVAEVAGKLAPIVEQAVYNAVGRSGYDVVTGPDMLGIAKNSVKGEVDPKLHRYGFTFVNFERFLPSLKDARMEEHVKAQGEHFRRQKEVDLLAAAGAVENEELQGKLENMRDTVAIRQQLRDQVSSDRLDRYSTKEEFSQALFEIDKQKLLRNEERDSLVAGYEERKNDHESLRGHLLNTIDLHREQELDQLRIDMDFAMRQSTLKQEIELSELSNSEEAQQWRHELRREKEESQHRNDEKQKNLTARWERIREAQDERRDDSWKTLLHEQKLQEIQADLEIARADRARQVALIQSDTEAKLADEKLQVQKRQQEWELELQAKQSGNQMEKMQQLQEMNAKFAERQLQVQAEVEKLKADSESERELNRIKAMSGLSTEALVAMADGNNAALLADLKKHESTQEVMKAQATAQPNTELNDERVRMYEKLNETERAKADAIAEAYKTAMQLQQGTSTTAPPPQSPPPVTGAQSWHVLISGQQQGPYTAEQLASYIHSGHVTHQTMVWRQGLANWLPVGQVPELASSLPPTAPPPPPPAP